ncbi:MAG: NrdH-redoxin [Polyangiaceae bacterium]|nr:NrdH-redoxin [Polyangiaceae bacterium]
MGAALRQLAITLVLFSVLLFGCSKKNEAPPPVVKDQTVGMLFTWVDEHGDLHVEQSPKDVPLVGRDVVRVVDPSREDGTHDSRIFLVDLRNPTADGSYPVSVSTRKAFDKIADARRDKPARVADKDPPGDDDPWHGGRPRSGNPGAKIIIYGASWCGACHEAAAYLRRKNIPYVEKDVETEPGAAAEMSAKLQGAGLPRGSIPVLDVRGRILVGFSPDAVDQALGKGS